MTKSKPKTIPVKPRGLKLHEENKQARFLKSIGLGTAGLSLIASPALASEAEVKLTGEKLPSKIRKVKETFTVCAFCGCGCGIILYSNNDNPNKIIFCEGIRITQLMKDPFAPKATPLLIPITQ
ncbi:hypothetical protein N752_15725 [Desulforamulus aquiferis]|nr:hypothetical protein N752_15725 [Desulforamulus aquiferis]